jgi:hypothetical protein
MNARIDITDIYAFQKSGDPNTSILILNVNPLASTPAIDFDPEAIYELRIDTNGDAVADIAFRSTFSDVRHGQQFARVRRAMGRRAARSGRAGYHCSSMCPRLSDPSRTQQLRGNIDSSPGFEVSRSSST